MDINLNSREEEILNKIGLVADQMNFDAYVIGTGIYKGGWLAAAETFLRKFRESIGDKPLYYWIMCIRILEEGGYDHVMEEYVPHHVLKRYNLQQGEAFAGVLKYGDIDFAANAPENLIVNLFSGKMEIEP